MRTIVWYAKKERILSVGVVYEIECMEEGCNKKYVGQTGWSLYGGMKEHNTFRENDSKLVARYRYEEHRERR